MAQYVILGATGGVGSALARRLVQQGRTVRLVGRNAGRLSTLAAELGQRYDLIDEGSAASIGAVLQQIAADGPISAIVHAIGSVLLKPAHLTSEAEFQEVLQTNLMSAFAVVRAAGQLMREQGGSVVLFGSAAADVGLANHEAIAAAKAGVIGLARSAAATYASSDIRFNVINPGLVKTEMTRRIWSHPSSAAASAEMHALGRLGEPDQIASLAEWLIDPANDWITGQVIGVDGGLSRVIPVRKAKR